MLKPMGLKLSTLINIIKINTKMIYIDRQVVSQGQRQFRLSF